MSRFFKNAVCLFAVLAVAGSLMAAEHADSSLSRFGKYPLSVCPNCGDPNPSTGKLYTKVYDGREVAFCCADCAPPFEKNLTESMQSLNMMIAEAQRPGYPLKSCLVCGDGLGSDETVTESVYLNQYVKFCCQECMISFSKKPDLYLGNLPESKGTSSDAEKQ